MRDDLTDATKIALGELFGVIRREYGPTAIITLCHPSAFAYHAPRRRRGKRSSRRVAVQAKRKRLGFDNAGHVPVTDPFYKEIAQYCDEFYQRHGRWGKKKYMRMWQQEERRYRLSWGMAAYNGTLAEKLRGGK